MSTATDTPGLARRERTALADLLLTLGPEQPTCCGEWTTNDLAAHLVARERRPDSGPGLVVPAFAGYTERVRQKVARRPFADLVATLRRPSRLLPGSVDALVNTNEYFIHHEDVRRARPDWVPRELPLEDQQTLWRAAAGMARRRLRRIGFPVVVAAAGHDEVRVNGTGESVRLAGAPSELLLFLSGRQRLARVELTGPPEQVSRLRGAPLDM